jgi:hypothetical protein
MAENSVITKYRRQKLCQITSGAIDVLAPITQIAFGDGGVDSDGDPIAPVDTASSLGHELVRYNIDSVAYPVNTTARYTVTIPAADLDGAAISEAALVDLDGQLCAIKTMYVKRKDEGVTFSFTFDDEF